MNSSKWCFHSLIAPKITIKTTPSMAPPMHVKQQQSQQPPQPQQLHNFDLPALRWATSSPSSSSPHRDHACSADETERKKMEAEEWKKKFVIRLKTKNNNVPIKAEVEDHVSMAGDETVVESENCVSIVDGEKEDAEEAEVEEEEEPPMKMWNLRPRNVVMKTNWRHDNNAIRGAVKIESNAVQEIKNSSKEEKKKFLASLSKKEIENDFVAMTGSKPSRKPHKRSKSLQRKIDFLYPGKWLSGLTPETYKVNEGEAARLKM